MSRNQKKTADKLRFVLDPQGKVIFDLMQILPSSDEVLLPVSQAAVKQACETSLFFQLDQNAHWVANLPEQVGAQMRKRMLETLHLLKRSGSLIGGYDKVKDALMHKPVVMLLQANDASEDGRAKVANLARHKNIHACLALSRAEIASVTGNENQVHLVILASGLAAMFCEIAMKLAAYEAEMH